MYINELLHFINYHNIDNEDNNNFNALLQVRDTIDNYKSTKETLVTTNKIFNPDFIIYQLNSGLSL